MAVACAYVYARIRRRGPHMKAGETMATTKKRTTKAKKAPKKPKLRKVYDLKGEEWKLVSGTDDYYVSNRGRFKRITHLGENLRKASIDPEGYCRVNIGHKKLRLHRLVAEAFVPNPNNYPVVDHLDADKKNNNASNLEWVTQQENTKRAAEMGLITGGERTLALAIDESLTGYLYKNIPDLSRDLGIDSRAANKVALGKQKTAGGYRVIKLRDFEDRRCPSTDEEA